jgi:O-antigen ligase
VLFELASVLLLGTILVLLLRGRLMAAGAVLLAFLYANLSDIGIHYHGWPSLAQPLVLLFAVILFVRRTRAGGSRSLGACIGFWSAAAIYLAVLLASSIWAPDGGAAGHQASNVAKDLLIVYVIVELFDDPAGQRLAIWALVVTGALLAGISVLQAVTHTYGNSYLGLARADVRQLVGSTHGYRSAGPIGDPNFYGLMLAAVVPLAVLRFLYEGRPILRAGALGSTLLLVAGVGLSYSRGALLALVVSALLLLVLVRLPVRKLLTGAAVLLVLAALSPAHYLQRLENIGRADHSFQGHAGSLSVALAMFADHPLLGVGADNYQATYLPYARQLHAFDAASTAHDLYLATASETGLIGLLAFGGAMFAVLRSGWRTRAAALGENDAQTAGLVTGSLLATTTYLTGCLFLPLAYPRYLWLFAGLTLTISLRSTEPARAPAQIPALDALGPRSWPA